MAKLFEKPGENHQDMPNGEKTVKNIEKPSKITKNQKNRQNNKKPGKMNKNR